MPSPFGTSGASISVVTPVSGSAVKSLPVPLWTRISVRPSRVAAIPFASMSAVSGVYAKSPVIGSA